MVKFDNLLEGQPFLINSYLFEKKISNFILRKIFSLFFLRKNFMAKTCFDSDAKRIFFFSGHFQHTKYPQYSESLTHFRYFDHAELSSLVLKWFQNFFLLNPPEKGKTWKKFKPKLVISLFSREKIFRKKMEPSKNHFGKVSY